MLEVKEQNGILLFSKATDIKDCSEEMSTNKTDFDDKRRPDIEMFS